MSNKTNGNLRRVETQELKQLQSLCKTIYPIYFGDYWESDGLAQYLEAQFGTSTLLRDLESNSIDYYFICENELNVGFLKICYETRNHNFNSTTTAELEKIYIAPEAIGKGLGKLAIDSVLGIIRTRNKNALVLDVLDTNMRGIAFYKKFGFELHSRTRLKAQNFKAALSGLHVMYYRMH